MNPLKFLILVAAVALVGLLSWRLGDERGYERGRKTKGAEFQIMLDANVYWAHRDALSEIARADSAWALKRELQSLEDYHDRVMKAKGSEVPSTIKENFIDQVERNHQGHLERFQAILKELESKQETPAKPAAEPAPGP